MSQTELDVRGNVLHKSIRVQRLMNVTLHADIYEPADREPKAQLFYVHGMSEYRKHYEEMAEFFVSHGLRVFLFDLRGHGDSLVQGKRGFFAYNDGTDLILDDMQSMFTAMREGYEDLPIFLLGHSLGAMLSKAYLKRNPSDLSGLILSGSPAPERAINAKRFFLGLLSFFVPDKPALVMSRNNAKRYLKKDMHVENPQERLSWLYCDQSQIESLLNDERTNFCFTYRALHDVCTLIKEIYARDEWMITQKNLPILFVTGQDDICARVESGGIEQQMKQLRSKGYESIEARFYAHSRHQVLRDFDKKQVWQDIDDFINRALEAKVQ
ncbi:MAG: alpha/beta fold hydrolase [Eubacteriales bacterium]|nr:alpha/beta fold hydrolase [Eubacteriales bacterium]